MKTREEKLEAAIKHYIQVDTEHRSKYGAGIISQLRRKEYTELLKQKPADEVIEIQLIQSPINWDKELEELR